ncbi:hypothetical protein ACFX19_045886 [Malus domestica]
METDEQLCSDCKKYTQVVIDHRSGDTICTDCGLIVEAFSIDVTAEWRNFADKDPKEDRARVGASLNPLLDNGILTTCISQEKKQNKNKDNAEGVVPPNNRLNNVATSNPQMSLAKATEYLEAMACRLDNHGLPEGVLYDAKVLYKKAVDKKICRGRKFGAMMAACLFLSCQENHSSRTPKEIAGAANGPSMKEITKMVKLLKEELELVSKATDAGDLWRRYCSNLGMNSIQDRKAVEETLKNLAKLDIRRSPTSVVAAVLYMIVKLASNGKTVEDVQQETGASVGTIKSTYKEIYPYASTIVPNWYCKYLEDIKNLNTR